MLYETLSQPTILYIFLLAGIASGFVIGAGKVINLIFGDNFVVRYLIDILCVAFCFCLFFYFNVKYNFGQMRLYIMLIFGVGIIAQRYSVGFFVAKSRFAGWPKISDPHRDPHAEMRQRKQWTQERRTGSLPSCPAYFSFCPYRTCSIKLPMVWAASSCFCLVAWV